MKSGWAFVNTSMFGRHSFLRLFPCSITRLSVTPSEEVAIQNKTAHHHVIKSTLYSRPEVQLNIGY